jgi:hypothetical protein
MPYPHHSTGNSNGAYMVRPGTSAALTARSIDATIHPPIVRAQEAVQGAVAAVVPRVAPALDSPLFLGAFALTVVLAWMTIRSRFRPSGLLLSALLLMTLTSFTRAAPAPEPRIADDEPARVVRVKHREQDRDEDHYSWRDRMSRTEPMVIEVPATEWEVPETPDVPEPGDDAEPVEIPDVEPTALPPDFSVQIPLPNAEDMALAEQQLRASVAQLQRQLRQQIRREKLRREQLRRQEYRYRF